LPQVTPTGKEILKNINLGMYLGAKIGILGSNGAGKSSLMRILAGVDTNFDGNMNMSSGIRVGYLAQVGALPHVHHMHSTPACEVALAAAQGAAQ
jgi:energy-dependent translational throttle protein EttA